MLWYLAVFPFWMLGQGQVLFFNGFMAPRSAMSPDSFFLALFGMLYCCFTNQSHNFFFLFTGPKALRFRLSFVQGPFPDLDSCILENEDFCLGVFIPPFPPCLNIAFFLAFLLLHCSCSSFQSILSSLCIVGAPWIKGRIYESNVVFSPTSFPLFLFSFRTWFSPS